MIEYLTRRPQEESPWLRPPHGESKHHEHLRLADRVFKTLRYHLIDDRIDESAPSLKDKIEAAFQAAGKLNTVRNEILFTVPIATINGEREAQAVLEQAIGQLAKPEDQKFAHFFDLANLINGQDWISGSNQTQSKRTPLTDRITLVQTRYLERRRFRRDRWVVNLQLEIGASAAEREFEQKHNLPELSKQVRTGLGAALDDYRSVYDVNTKMVKDKPDSVRINLTEQFEGDDSVVTAVLNRIRLTDPPFGRANSLDLHHDMLHIDLTCQQSSRWEVNPSDPTASRRHFKLRDGVVLWHIKRESSGTGKTVVTNQLALVVNRGPEVGYVSDRTFTRIANHLFNVLVQPKGARANSEGRDEILYQGSISEAYVNSILSNAILAVAHRVYTAVDNPIYVQFEVPKLPNMRDQAELVDNEKMWSEIQSKERQVSERTFSIAPGIFLTDIRRPDPDNKGAFIHTIRLVQKPQHNN